MTEFPLYCVVCGNIASRIYRGYSLCQNHFVEAEEARKRAAEMNDDAPGTLSDLFD